MDLDRFVGEDSTDSGGGSRRRRVLGRQYEVIKRLGQGSFGIASVVLDHKATSGSDDLKVLKEIFIGDKLPDNGLDAVREAKLLSKLSHPNIVKYNASFVQGEMFCIVTEYCDNGDLNMMIKRVRKEGKRFEEKLVATYFVQLLMAIKYMHDRKLLHRDIKASNIFLRNNVIKLGDLGITRLLERTTDMASTFTGTPNYMSPEVVQHQGYNSKSDMWSVGCVLFEMCALEVAFQATNLLALMKKIVYEATPTLPKSYTRDLSEIFNMLMEKDTAQRASATTVLRHKYIVKHVSDLKSQIVEQQAAAEQDSSAIAEALSGYSHSRKERKQEVQSRAESSADSSHVGESRDAERAPQPRSNAAGGAGGKAAANGKRKNSQHSSKGAASKEKLKKSSSVDKPRASKQLPVSPNVRPPAPASPARGGTGAGAGAAARGTPKKKKAEKLPPKKMTPREQLEQRKRLRADEEAGRLKKEVSKQYVEQKITYDRNRKQNSVKRPPPWVAENPDVCETVTLFSVTDPAGLEMLSPQLTPQPQLLWSPASPSRPVASKHGRVGSPGDDDGRQYLSQVEYDEMPVGGGSGRSSRLLPNRQPAEPRVTSPCSPGAEPGISSPDSPSKSSASRQLFHFKGEDGGDSIEISFDDLTLDGDTLSPRRPKGGDAAVDNGGDGDDCCAPLELKAPARRIDILIGDGQDTQHYIPDDPDEADELYTREADFESDSGSEGEAPYGRRGLSAAAVRGGVGGGGDGSASANDSGGSVDLEESDGAGDDNDNVGDDNGSEACDSGDERDDLDAMVACMANALELTMQGNDGHTAETLHDQGPDTMSLCDPQHRIQQCRRNCIQVLGEEPFKKVYHFLQASRFGAQPLSDMDVRSGLEKLVGQVRDCFLVDQLIFLEYKWKEEMEGGKR